MSWPGKSKKLIRWLSDFPSICSIAASEPTVGNVHTNSHALESTPLRRKGLEVVHEDTLFPVQTVNPYLATFEEDEQEDIIRITVGEPAEAYYYDENGQEKIELREQDPKHSRFTEDGPAEVFRSEEGLLDPEDILREAEEWKHNKTSDGANAGPS
jgi:hypothetical protein